MSQIQKVGPLMALIATAVGFGIFITVLGVYLFGPTGQYVLQNALVSPDNLEHLDYNDVNTKTGGNSRFVLDSINFSYYNAARKGWQSIKISPETYAKFYQVAEKDVSLRNVTSDVLARFGQGSIAGITIEVRTYSRAAWDAQTKIFQAVQFGNGDYYRVQLREDKTGNSWVYFYHPGLEPLTQSLFIQKQ